MNELKASSTRRSLRRVGAGLAAVAIAVALASCGSGSSDNGTPTPTPTPVSNTPPTSASQSVDGFIAYLKVLVATKPDTTQPLDVTTFVAPTTETGSPDPSI